MAPGRARRSNFRPKFGFTELGFGRLSVPLAPLVAAEPNDKDAPQDADGADDCPSPGSVNPKCGRVLGATVLSDFGAICPTAFLGVLSMSWPPRRGLGLGA